MEKQIKERGTNYTIWTDGTAVANCIKCGKEEFLPLEKVAKITQITDWYKNYVCLSCWRAGQEAKKEELHERKIDEIIVGQAMNLTVKTIIALYPNELRKGGEETKKLLKKYFQSYKNFLIEVYRNDN